MPPAAVKLLVALLNCTNPVSKLVAPVLIVTEVGLPPAAPVKATLPTPLPVIARAADGRVIAPLRVVVLKPFKARPAPWKTTGLLTVTAPVPPPPKVGPVVNVPVRVLPRVAARVLFWARTGPVPPLATNVNASPAEFVTVVAADDVLLKIIPFSWKLTAMSWVAV